MPSKVFNWVILNCLQEAVDKRLWDQQARFRKDRSCTEHRAQSILIEQSIECHTILYMNFIDFEKAFDSLDRTTLWQLIEHYGIPIKIINLIKDSYHGNLCKVMHGGQLSQSFEVKTGAKQGCLLSPFLFLLVIDCVIRDTTEGMRNGIQWIMWEQLDADTRSRINKARVVFNMLIKIWSSKNISSNTKICIFNSNVKQVMLYASET